MTKEQKRQHQYYLDHREHALEVAARYRESHREQLRAKARALYWSRREQGICTVCGSSPAVEGKAECVGCRAYELEYKRRSKERRSDNGQSHDSAGDD